MARSVKAPTKNKKVAKRAVRAKYEYKPPDKTSQNPCPRLTIPPFKEKAILHVGPMLDRRFPWEKWNIASTVTQKLQAILDDPSTRDDENFFVYLTSENRKKSVSVPVMVAIKARCPPLTHIALPSIQMQTEEFKVMDEIGLNWAKLSGSDRVFTLTSSKPLDHHTLEYMVPYLRREAEATEPITTVTTIWKGEEISWSPTDDGSIDEAVNEIINEDFPEWQGDKAEIKTQLMEHYRLLQEAALKKTELKTNLFDDIVDRLSNASGLSEADVRQSLLHMKVYKIYPDHPDLNPVVNAFGTFPFKNRHINRYIADANEVW
jgi:hypothetical protein